MDGNSINETQAETELCYYCDDAEEYKLCAGCQADQKADAKEHDD